MKTFKFNILDFHLFIIFYFKNFFSTAPCLALSDGLSSTYDLPVARRFTLDVPNQPQYLESIHKRYLYQSFLERLRWRLHWEAICIMPPQWRQTEASYADIASHNPPQTQRREERKLCKKVMIESLKESYADFASHNPIQNLKKRRKTVTIESYD